MQLIATYELTLVLDQLNMLRRSKILAFATAFEHALEITYALPSKTFCLSTPKAPCVQHNHKKHKLNALWFLGKTGSYIYIFLTLRTTRST